MLKVKELMFEKMYMSNSYINSIANLNCWNNKNTTKIGARFLLILVGDNLSKEKNFACKSCMNHKILNDYMN